MSSLDLKVNNFNFINICKNSFELLRAFKKNKTY